MQSAPLTPVELKKALLEHGFEVYRTVGNRVHLAERVRDNLIMDSNVSVFAGSALSLRVAVRAQHADFHGDSEAQMFARALEVGKPALERGYKEVDRTIVPIIDPSDPSRTLDTWYEVSFELGMADLGNLIEELGFLLKMPKVAEEIRGATG